MTEIKDPSPWAAARFGETAVDLMREVPKAIHAAHEDALRGHLAAEMKPNDGYGNMLKVKQFDKLLEMAQQIPGLITRKPDGVQSRFELVVVPETSVALLPLRVPAERGSGGGDIRLRRPVSDFQQALLALSPSKSARQMTIEQAFDSDEKLEAEYAEIEALEEQLAQFGRVVVVGFCSNPARGVWDLRWGDLTLLDAQSGEAEWVQFELLPIPIHVAENGRGVRSALTALQDSAGVVTARFDEGATNEDFNLQPRSPSIGVPSSEVEEKNEEIAEDEDR